MTDLAENLVAERRAAARLLLAEPLVTARAQPDGFPLIRRHSGALARQLNQFLGYRLTVEPGFARLRKASLGRDCGRRLERASGVPFTPRTYAYLALTLAALVTAPDQLLLSELVARIRGAAAQAGIDLGEPNRAAERRAMVAALKQLMAWQVLTEDEGSVDSLAGDEGADALLTIDREIARHLVSGPVGEAATIDDLIELAAGARDASVRHRIRRRLVETPVVYAAELSEDERDWLRRNTERERRSFAEFLGLEAEIRAEGIALIDPAGELSDIGFPGTGTVAWAALLLVAELAERLAPDDAAFKVAIPDGLIEELLGRLAGEHAGNWAQQLTQAPRTLRDEVLGLLSRLRLIIAADPPASGWMLTAAAARYLPDVTR
jgi:uncharacterized protein (TIGR02678 family)